MHIPCIVQLLLHKNNSTEKLGRIGNKFSSQEQRLDTVLTSFLVYFVLAPLLALFQRVYICACPVRCTAIIITQTQFPGKPGKARSKVSLQE